MAGSIPDLHATVRTGTGKGAARQSRRNGNVPGIVFGGDTDPLPIDIPFNKLLTMLRAGKFKSTLFNLKVDGHDDVRVICRDVQRDKVKDLPTHLDLMRLRRTSRINLFVAVEFINEDTCVGLKKGGTLTVVRPEVELMVTASDIPEKIVVDLEKMEFGESVTASMLDLPKGARVTIDRDFVVATIAAPSGIKATEDDAEATEGEAEAPAAEAAAEE